MVFYLFFKWFVCGQHFYLRGTVKIEKPGCFQWVKGLAYIVMTVAGDVGIFLNVITALISLQYSRFAQSKKMEKNASTLWYLFLAQIAIFQLGMLPKYLYAIQLPYVLMQAHCCRRKGKKLNADERQQMDDYLQSHYKFVADTFTANVLSIMNYTDLIDEHKRHIAVWNEFKYTLYRLFFVLGPQLAVKVFIYIEQGHLGVR